MNIALDLALKFGGVLAVVGMLIGGWLWYPSCETSFGVKQCRNVLGEVSVNSINEPNTPELMLTGGAVGAIAGAVVGLFIAWLWPHTKKVLGME